MSLGTSSLLRLIRLYKAGRMGRYFGVGIGVSFLDSFGGSETFRRKGTVAALINNFGDAMRQDSSFFIFDMTFMVGIFKRHKLPLIL